MSGSDGAAIPSECPAVVRDDLAVLAAALDQEVPPKILDRNLLICTWNIRSFSAYTPSG